MRWFMGFQFQFIPSGSEGSGSPRAAASIARSLAGARDKLRNSLRHPRRNRDHLRQDAVAFRPLELADDELGRVVLEGAGYGVGGADDAVDVRGENAEIAVAGDR